MPDVPFAAFREMVESFGFRLVRVRGRHHLFAHRQRPLLITMQRVEGFAKAFQVEVFLRMVQQHGLTIEEGPRA